MPAQKLPSRYAVVKTIQMDEPAEAPHETELLHENWLDPGSGHTSSGRGRGGRGRGRGRTRGGRSQRRVIGSRSETGRRSIATNSESFGQVLGWKGRTRGRGGRRRGRRTIRSRQKPVNNRVVKIIGKREPPEEIIFEKVPGKLWQE
ncbi:hypothetical protein L1049_024307 [Liquidambar formosana]|uniref:Uncharacterized protein n=1 Tax=Liquidambar formosana TaxID=63359 RepID=A0AAP0S0M1_LIQFO